MRFPIKAFIMATTVCFPFTGAFAADAESPDECTGPCLNYSNTTDLTAAWLHSDDGTVAKSNFLLPSSETNLQFKANDTFSLIANIVSEQVIEAEAGKDQIFNGLGTYVDVLQAQLDFDNVSLWAGKIHPAFGRAWDVTPGLHGTDLAENYELAERLGGGASINFDMGGLSNTLQASAFTSDRSVLSESLFHNRGRKSLSDGGAGNASGVSSIALALDGCLGAETDACYDDGKFGYQIAARFQKAGEDGNGHEVGLSASANSSFDLSEESKLKLFGEAVWFKNSEGSGNNTLMFTGSAALQNGQMTWSMAYSQQHDFVADGVDSIAHSFDASAVYNLDEDVSMVGEKWSVGAGYNLAKDEGQTEHTVGLKLTAAFDGSTSFGK